MAANAQADITGLMGNPLRNPLPFYLRQQEKYGIIRGMKFKILYLVIVVLSLFAPVWASSMSTKEFPPVVHHDTEVITNMPFSVASFDIVQSSL